MPAVSVVMSSYNYGRFISDAIRSVLDQSFDDLEFIIVDDGSMDGSQNIIKGFEKKDRRIRTQFHKKNIGFSRTINDGWNLARGKYIANISSDDLWDRKKLERQMEVLEHDDNLVVWTEGEIIDAMGKPTGELFTQMHNASNKKLSGDIFAELLRGNFIFASSRIFKKENLHGRNYSEDLLYLSDYRFAVDMASEYEYYFIKEPLTKYRIHGDNTIFSDPYGFESDTIKLMEYFLSAYGDRISNDMRIRLHLNSVNTLKGQLFRAEMDTADMRSSVIWLVLMAYQRNIVERGLPQGTKRRGVYDGFINGLREIANKRI
jgi:glycosyltransferase involved in cell wall biosynthesis